MSFCSSNINVDFVVQLLIHVKKNATTSLRFLKITTYKKQSLESLKVKTSYLKTNLYVHCTIFFLSNNSRNLRCCDRLVSMSKTPRKTTTKQHSSDEQKSVFDICQMQSQSSLAKVLTLTFGVVASAALTVFPHSNFYPQSAPD